MANTVKLRHNRIWFGLGINKEAKVHSCAFFDIREKATYQRSKPSKVSSGFRHIY